MLGRGISSFCYQSANTGRVNVILFPALTVLRQHSGLAQSVEQLAVNEKAERFTGVRVPHPEFLAFLAQLVSAGVLQTSGRLFKSDRKHREFERLDDIA